MSPLLDPDLSPTGHLPQPDEPIAIIGLACRFPGDATTPSKLWDLLVNKRTAWSPIPESKWHPEAHYHPSSDRGGSTFVQGGHFLKEGEQNGKRFDAPFFGITRTEAMSMDLQQRVVSK